MPYKSFPHDNSRHLQKNSGPSAELKSLTLKKKYMFYVKLYEKLGSRGKVKEYN